MGIDRELWDFRPEWLEWVRQVWSPGKGRVQLRGPSPDHRRADFAARATRAFRERGVPVVNIKTWVSVQVPEDGDGYAHGYPHTHEPADGVTLVHYLDPGDVPAALEIFSAESDRVIEIIEPERGLTVFMANAVRHGVRKNRGTRDRVQLIATALPR